MAKPKDHVQMALNAAEAFAKDGKLDSQELAGIIEISERDGIIDHDEIRVLRSIITRIEPGELSESMRGQLQEILKKVSKPQRTDSPA